MIVAVVNALKLVRVSHCTEAGLGTQVVGGDSVQGSERGAVVQGGVLIKITRPLTLHLEEQIVVQYSQRRYGRARRVDWPMTGSHCHFGARVSRRC